MRARNIKPGFFKNEELWELPPLTRILFAGLWCLADREGRLEDRPKRIKVEVLPADEYDADAGLQALHNCGLISRFSVDGKHYIQVTNFLKHQNPHVKEAPSTIPAPDKHSASTGISGTSPADSLIPDSGFSDSLKTDSVNPGDDRSLLSEKDQCILGTSYRDNMAAIEAKARSLSMPPWGAADDEIATRLMSDYTAEWLLEAMGRAAKGKSRTWGYIEGILKNWRTKGGIDNEPGSLGGRAAGNTGADKAGAPASIYAGLYNGEV